MGIHSPDKENLKIISCYKDGSMAVRDLNNNESKIEFFNCKHDFDINCILLSSDKEKLISGDKNGTIKVWDVRTGELLRTVSNESDGDKWSIKCMINSSVKPNEILIASNLCYIRILDLNSYTFILKIRVHDRRINCLEYLTPELFLSASSDLTIKIRNLESEWIDSCQTIDCAQDETRCLRKINDNTFACLFHDGSIQIFSSDKESMEFKCSKTLIHNSGYPRDLKVCSNLNLLLIASRAIHMYSLSDFTCVGILCLNTNVFARSIEILPKNRLIASYNNHTLEIWCLKTGKSLSVHKDHSSLINNILFYTN